MVEERKDLNAFEFPSQKLGVKTKVQSQNKQRLVVFNKKSESGVPSVLKLSWDVPQYKKTMCNLCTVFPHAALTGNTQLLGSLKTILR